VHTPAAIDALADTSGRVVLFPVRHHSPAAARLVRAAIDDLKPDAVLIEGPADFNDRIDELFLPHRPPLAIYSYLHTPDRRQGVYYPFCEHSPEWQAARHGHNRGAAVRFIDLPWADLAAIEDRSPTNRYADRVVRGNPFVESVSRQLGVESFTDAWDTLFEIDPPTDLGDYLRRCHRLCVGLRLGGGEVEASDAAREAFMARQIRAALTEFTGKLLVVIGGFHALGIHELLRSEPPAEVTLPPVEVLDRGVALTPYSFERLDSLTGYNAGMPNPGFTHQVWLADAKGKDVHAALMRNVVAKLREKKQAISSADLIGAETTARALAAIRGHARVWRTDWLDGLTAALLKDDSVAGATHPVMAAIHEVLRGCRRWSRTSAGNSTSTT
jgi:hypothetical protein